MFVENAGRSLDIASNLEKCDHRKSRESDNSRLLFWAATPTSLFTTFERLFTMPMMKIDFYEIIMPEDSKTFHECIEDARKKKDDASRNIEYGDSFFRLDDASWSEKNGNIWQGDMTRIRMSGLPSKANKNGKKADLGLNDDEGIGEDTCFLFCPNLNVLAIQRNRFGMSSARFAHYFESICNIEGMIELSPVIGGNSLKRLQNIKEVRSVEVRFAGTENPDVFDTEFEAAHSVMSLMDQFQSPTATIQFSMGRESGKLSPSNIMKFIRSSFKVADKDGAIDKVVVTGRTEEGDRDVLDMLKYRLTDSAEVPTSKRTRTMAYSKRKQAIFETWRQHKPYLKKLFG